MLKRIPRIFLSYTSHKKTDTSDSIDNSPELIQTISFLFIFLNSLIKMSGSKAPNFDAYGLLSVLRTPTTLASYKSINR